MKLTTNEMMKRCLLAGREAKRIDSQPGARSLLLKKAVNVPLRGVLLQFKLR